MKLPDKIKGRHKIRDGNICQEWLDYLDSDDDLQTVMEFKNSLVEQMGLSYRYINKILRTNSEFLKPDGEEVYILERWHKKTYPNSKVEYDTIPRRKNVSKKMVCRVYDNNVKHYGVLTCILCSKPIDVGEGSIEHLVPISRGGTNKYSNLGVAHLRCNIKKRTKTYEEYINENS